LREFKRNLAAAREVAEELKKAQGNALGLRLQSSIDQIQLRVNAAKEAGQKSLDDRAIAALEELLVTASQAVAAGDFETAEKSLATLDGSDADRGENFGHHQSGP
jgi:hypothetical protein